MSANEFYTPDGQQFMQTGMNQLDHRVLGEEEAKLGLLLGYVTGLNVALVGEPGGGKTTLSAEAHRLVSDIADENVARVPHHSDLTPQQLIGASTTISKEITNTSDNSAYVERTTAKVEPIIHANTQVIWLDELNRVNPFAVNGVLGALENGKVTTDAGEVELKGLELAISTMNPTETRQATFPVAAATASRHAIGIIMGNDRRDVAARDAKIEQLLGGWEPSDISPITTTGQLHELRAATTKIALPASLNGLAKHLIRGTVDVLAANHVQEADPRITKHVAKIARGLALLNGERHVQEDNLYQAIDYVMTARLGIMGVRGSHDLHGAVEGAINDVVSRVQ